MNKPFTLEQMAQRDMRNALAFGQVLDQLFSSFTKPAPVKVPPRIIIRTMKGTEIAANIYCQDGVNARNQWGWIVDHVKEHFGCDADDVSCIETEDGDMIAVCGKIVAYSEVER